MRQVILSILFIMIGSTVFSQDVKPERERQFMQVTTIESVLAGGLGRSKLIVTGPEGAQKEADFNNLFSAAGINFKNIKENEERLIKTLKTYADDGWTLEQVTPLTLSQGESGSGGIFMTRYLLSRLETSKGF